MVHQTPAAEPIDQMQLALERTYLAYERTLMAWIRTALALITFGFTIYKYFQYVREFEPARPVDQVLTPRLFGLAMIATGVFTLAMALWQHRQSLMRLRTHYPTAPVSLSGVLAGLIAALGILAFIATILHR